MRIHMPRWTVPSDPIPRVGLGPGSFAPRFQTTKFGCGFADNLAEWFKRSPRRLRGVPSSLLEVNWHPTRSAFWRSQALSVCLYAAVVVLVLFALARGPKNEPQMAIHVTTLLDRDVSDYLRKLPPGSDLPEGGGGGGKHSKSSVTKGDPPKISAFQMAPPSLPHDENPRLIADATLLGSPDLQFPTLNLDRYGDPLVHLISDSEGPGSGGGMGDGNGTGDGGGTGPGLGPGSRGGFGGRVYQAGNGVGYPLCAYCPDAKYSEEARKAKFQGVVILRVVVTPDGRAANIRIISSPGLGLDQEAIKAVETWRFRAAMGPNRQPVATQIAIEVQFRLL